MCRADVCRAYGKNWTCPPHCGTPEECAARLGRYRRGVLLQTVGHTSKTVDTAAYRRTEQQHLKQFYLLAEKIKAVCPDALCLGSGGCRICPSCAWPEPCRFPEKACSSMEAYGLFVTQVCRDSGCAYHYGERTVTYTACILF
jgi:predicted metal-binding protein